MKDKQTGVAVTIADVLNFVGGVSGMIALGALIFWGGATVEKLRSVDYRVTAIENGGSSTFRTHLAADARDMESVNSRLKMLEENMLLIHRMDMKVESVGIKLDALTKQLEKHEKQTQTKNP